MIIFIYIYILLGVVSFLSLFYFVSFISVLKLIPGLIPILLIIALFTLLERKVLGGFQRRRGPNVTGLWGLLQPFADALKLLFKETIIPGLSNLFLFIFAPMISFTLSLLSWSVIPLGYGVVLSDINLGLLFLFAMSSLGVYGIIISGWSSNNKYAFLGGLRAAAQFISYEVSIGISIMPILLVVNDFNLTSIVLFQNHLWFILIFWPSFLLFFIAALAETNRIPFDLPEAEAELIAGYNVEYSATTFVLFFLAEYSNILIMSILISIFFWGGWLAPLSLLLFIPNWFWFSLKICLIVLCFIIIRASLPRYRYDQLMLIGWKILLPMSLVNFFIAFICLFILC